MLFLGGGDFVFDLCIIFTYYNVQMYWSQLLLVTLSRTYKIEAKPVKEELQEFFLSSN